MRFTADITRVATLARTHDDTYGAVSTRCREWVCGGFSTAVAPFLGVFPDGTLGAFLARCQNPWKEGRHVEITILVLHVDRFLKGQQLRYDDSIPIWLSQCSRIV